MVYVSKDRLNTLAINKISTFRSLLIPDEGPSLKQVYRLGNESIL